MDKYHLFSSQKPEIALSASKVKSKTPQAYSNQAKFLEQALNKDLLPDGLNKKLASRRAGSTTLLKAPRYFAHLDDDTPLEHKVEENDKLRKLLYERSIERKKGE